MPPFTASTRYWLARVLVRRRRPGDRAEAAALAAAAAAIAEELGMAPLRRDAEALTAELEGRRAGPLTRREQQIAQLVSQGLTNRQIAAAVHISERTVDAHVQHILGKLGFTSRSQVAAWVVEVVITGSTGVIDELVEYDLIDEYRLMVFPTVLGGGRRLFDGHKNQVDIELTTAERVGDQAVRMVYNRRRDG